MRNGLPVVIFLAGLVACGGGNGAGGGGSVLGAPSYTATLVADYSAPPPANIVFFKAGKFRNGLTVPQSNYQSVLSVVLSPQPASTPSVTWSVTGGSVIIAPATASPSPMPTTTPIGQTPPPIFNSPELLSLATNAPPGPATVTVSIGPPVNAQFIQPVFTYPGLSTGCQFDTTTPSLADSLNFDSGLALTSGAGTASDLFTSLGSDQLHSADPCFGTPFADAPGAMENFHFPYYGTFISGSLSNFPLVAASDFRPDFTTNPAYFLSNPAFYGTYLFKTKGGNIVKAFLPIGPYEVTTSAGGQFPY
ncbi:MAG: hypothetical protein NVSMB31_05390 [Vulcanimicrobiaceae bacterium]